MRNLRVAPIADHVSKLQLANHLRIGAWYADGRFSMPGMVAQPLFSTTEPCSHAPAFISAVCCAIASGSWRKFSIHIFYRCSIMRADRLYSDPAAVQTSGTYLAPLLLGGDLAALTV